MKSQVFVCLLAFLAVPLIAQDQSLVLVTVNPCIAFDTRPVAGGTGAFAAEEQRSFAVAGSTADFGAQGGNPGGCGVPGWSGGQSVAKAVFINYVAIDAQGAGQIKAWAADRPEPAQGGLVNYQALTPPMNNSNGVVTELRQDLEGLDITVRARSAGVHVRGVILGYFTQDQITGVTAGTGLQGGGPSGEVMLGIANHGVGTQQIDVSGSIGGQVLTSTGSEAQWQNSSGGATGETGATGATGEAGEAGRGLEIPLFVRTQHDTPVYGGWYTSMVIGTDGLGLISYYDAANSNLKVAHCSNTACTEATYATVDSSGDVGRHSSITLGADGFGLISYQDATNVDLKVAHCEDIACTTASTATIDSAGDLGAFQTSVTTGSDGLGFITYYDETNAKLKIAHCNNTACSTAAILIPDFSGSNGQWSSVTIGADGLPLIYYLGLGISRGPTILHCSNNACSSSTITAFDGVGGAYGSLTVGADGLGLFSFVGGAGVRVGHCSNVRCTAMTAVDLDVGSSVLETSITIGSDGLGVVAYHDQNGRRLKVAHCSNVTCSTGTAVTVDATGLNLGRWSSIVTGTDGMPLISYHDFNLGKLRVAHLSNSLGVPFHRRR